jgi:hypothetical protein
MGYIKHTNTKVVSVETFIKVMEQTRLKAEARTKTFNDNKQNYYWYRLEYLNNEFKIQYLYSR